MWPRLKTLPVSQANAHIRTTNNLFVDTVESCLREGQLFQNGISEAARLHKIWVSIGVHELGDPQSKMWNSHLGTQLMLFETHKTHRSLKKYITKVRIASAT